MGFATTFCTRVSRLSSALQKPSHSSIQSFAAKFDHYTRFDVRSKATAGPWNPAQYEKFKLQRAKPFNDVVGLIKRDGLRSAVDLGCGTGELSRKLFDELGLERMIAIDSSASMLRSAAAFGTTGLTFQQTDIATYNPRDDLSSYRPEFDLLFSNAALHWLPQHETLFPRILSWVNNGGQVAIQMPQNTDHASHQIAKEVATELFPDVFPPEDAPQHTLSIKRYAELLFQSGFEEQICRAEVYGHVMPSGSEVVEWTKGALLTYYQSRLSTQDFEYFVDTYSSRLLAVIGTKRYFYAFKRLLIWGRKAHVE